MSRDLSVDMAAAIVASVVRPVLLVEGVLADASTVRYWTGLGTLSWNSQSWIGAGSIIGIGAVEETDDVKAGGVAVQFNGVPTTMVSLVLGSLANGTAGIIRLALLNSSNVVIDTPKVLFRGRLDGTEIGGTDVKHPTCILQYEHELVDLERRREWRWTAEHQRKLYPGDAGLDHIAALQDIEIPFGNKNRVGR